MQDVLADVFLADGYMYDHPLPQDSEKQVARRYHEMVFAKHNISSGQFYASMDFYTRHPDILEETLQNVIDSLSTMEAHTH